MPRSDNLAELLVQAGSPDIGFHQGVVVEWDESTGTNTINIAGVHLTNLPALNIGEFVILQPDDVVGLLRFKHTYFILGRIVLPAGPDRNRASFDFESEESEQNDFEINTARTAKATATFTPPTWADEVLVQVAANAIAWNNRAVQDYMGLRLRVDEVEIGGGDMFFVASPGNFAAGAVVASRLLTNPGATVTADCLMWANGASWGTLPAEIDPNRIHVTATALYRRAD